MVIELPTIYAISSSDYFAKGAINILNKLNILDSICFGSESGKISDIEKVADILVEKEAYIWNKISEFMKLGNSFASSREICLKEFLDSDTLSEINKPNNILAIDYIKAIKKIKSNITPYTIKREGSDFLDTTLTTDTNFASATSIRENIYNNNIENIEKYIPKETLELIKSNNHISNESLFELIKYKVILNKDILNKYNGVIEGLENRIIDSLNISKTYEDFSHNIKSKRYAMSSIKRMLLNILLNITKDTFNDLINNDINYAHVLSISSRGKNLLSKISQKSDINILTKINNNSINSLNRIDKKSLKLDILATNIHSSLLNENINKDYTNKL